MTYEKTILSALKKIRDHEDHAAAGEDVESTVLYLEAWATQRVEIAKRLAKAARLREKAAKLEAGE